jgi:polysaccharide biosynthesis PFTS motif protein
MWVGMVSSKSFKKTLFFSGMSLKLFWLLPWAKFLDWNLYVFDISSRPKQFMLLQKLHKFGWITRITDHNFAFYNTHSSAIETSNNIINKHINLSHMRLARALCESGETDLVFKRTLADHLRLLTAFNQHIINNIKIGSTTLFLSAKYYGIMKENPELIDPSIDVKYTFNLGRLRLKTLWLNMIAFYLLHLLCQPFLKNNKSKAAFNYAISVPFPWVAKFKGAREFTFLIDDKNIKKDEVVFFIEFKEKIEFYEHYRSLGFFLEGAQNVSNISDLFKASSLKIQNDFFIIAKLLFCSKRDFYVYDALITLLSSRISWAIISKKTIFKNYIYFNKESSSQIVANIFLKSQGIKTHAYSQFIGGTYQAFGHKSIFDKRNVLWSFLNPNYYYLNNQAMVDSMKLHSQTGVLHKNIGNIFSEKILEIKNDRVRINNIKKHYGISTSRKVISIFDTTYIQLKEMYSNYDEAQYFLKDMIKMAESLPNFIFLFKPSKSNEHYITRRRYFADDGGGEIVGLRQAFAKLPNTIMLIDSDDVLDIISISEIVLTNCFSSPTADALMANVSAFWYQSKTDVCFSDFNKIPNLVISGYADLMIHIEKILKDGYPTTFLNNPDFTYLIGNHNKNKKALTDLRLNIVNSLK